MSVGELTLKGVGQRPAWRLVGLAESQPALIPFAGRQAELARLREAFDRARLGHATLALVSGEPGIGKRRLVEEFMRGETDRALILRARCRPGSEVGASTPLRQLLAGATDDVPSAVAHSAGATVDSRFSRDVRARSAESWSSRARGAPGADQLLSYRPRTARSRAPDLR